MLENLSQFHGGGQCFGHWTGRLIYTEGVQYLAEQGKAYWLIDAIASYQRHKRVRLDRELREFQLWELEVNRTPATGEPMAMLTLRADSDRPAVIRQGIEYTDFPLDRIKLYVCDGTLMLPSEY